MFGGVILTRDVSTATTATVLPVMSKNSTE
jgi:hypothetical protein